MFNPNAPAQIRRNQNGFGTVLQKTSPLDMIKISPLKYIVMNNPQGVHDFLFSKGVNVGGNVLSTYNAAKKYSQLSGDQGMMEMIKNVDTPYKQMVLAAYGKESRFGGEEQPKKEETPSVKKEDREFAGIKLNTQTIIIALVIIVFFLLVLRPGK